MESIDLYGLSLQHKISSCGHISQVSWWNFHLHLCHELLDMEKYLISQGSKKPKLSTSTDSANRKKIEKQRDYDKNTRKRGFQSSWVTSYPWILFDAGNDAMFYTVCRPVLGELSQSKILINFLNMLVAHLWVVGAKMWNWVLSKWTMKVKGINLPNMKLTKRNQSRQLQSWAMDVFLIFRCLVTILNNDTFYFVSSKSFFLLWLLLFKL